MGNHWECICGEQLQTELVMESLSTRIWHGSYYFDISDEEFRGMPSLRQGCIRLTLEIMGYKAVEPTNG